MQFADRDKSGDKIPAECDDARLWLESNESDDSVKVAPLASEVLATTAELISRFLPPFIRDIARVDLALSRISEWKGGPTVEIMIRRPPESRPDHVDNVTRASSDAAGFPLERAAAGHQLWIQLALFEAMRVIDAAVAAARARYDEDLDEPFANVKEMLNSAVDSATVAGRTRLYIIDEPERHLHPALARKAARWLQELSSKHATQVVTATHSPLFLRLAGAVTWNYVDPHGGSVAPREDASRYPHSRVRAVAPEDLDAFSMIAETMGFDRGELFTNVELILFVEGESDREVLRGLFEPELHSAGVAVIPIHGAFGAERKGVVDAELLLRFTTATVGLLLDSLDREDAMRLTVDATYRKAVAARPHWSELREMARVVERAIANERGLVPFSIPTHDVFDLLDQDILKEQFPVFPGHMMAREQHAARNKKPGWKQFYADEYNADLLAKAHLFGQVAAEMRIRRLPLNPALERLREDILNVAQGGMLATT
jgi:hypothetical protein